MAKDLRSDPLLSGVPEVDGYKVLDPAVLYGKVGVGGMGSVYRGHHLNLEIDVAVKVLDPQLARQDPEFVTRFRREANLAAKINHPNLVRVYDVKEGHGLHYLVMEYVEGETALERVARKGPLGAVEALDIVLEAAKGLGAAHAEGVVHRDVKPENILIDGRGRVKVADLGLAKAVEGSGGVTRGRLQMGTPRYMPPEQWEDARKVGPPGDVWALGATFYFLLAADHAIAEGSLTEMFRKVCTEPFPDIRERRREVPDALVRILEQCTAREPEQRFADATQLAEALTQFRRRLQTPPQLPDEEAGLGTTRLASVSPPPLQTILKIGSTIRRDAGRATPPAHVAPPPWRRKRLAIIAVSALVVGIGAFWLARTIADAFSNGGTVASDYDAALEALGLAKALRESLKETPQEIEARLERTGDEAERAILKQVESAAREALASRQLVEANAAIEAGEAMLADREHGKARAKFEGAKAVLEDLLRRIRSDENRLRAEQVLREAAKLQTDVSAWYETNALGEPEPLATAKGLLRTAEEKQRAASFADALAKAQAAARAFRSALEAGERLLKSRDEANAALNVAVESERAWRAGVKTESPDSAAAEAKLAEGAKALGERRYEEAKASLEEAKRLYESAIEKSGVFLEARREAATAREAAAGARATWDEATGGGKTTLAETADQAAARGEECFVRGSFAEAAAAFREAEASYRAALEECVPRVPEAWTAIDPAQGLGRWAKKAQDQRTGIVFRLVEPGTFEMGSPDGEGELDEHPRHEVRITRPFYLAETETTVGQWRAFVGATGYATEAERADMARTWLQPLIADGFTLDERHPVTTVTFGDADAFCRQYGYRLPTEAEWEYACRAGTRGRYWWGEAEGDAALNGNFADQAAKARFPDWTVFPFDDGNAFLAPVGSFRSNPWGFVDMLGGVWEWCADGYDAGSYAKGIRDDPYEPDGETRVGRGGSWGECTPQQCRVAYRPHFSPAGSGDLLGFRAARGLPAGGRSAKRAAADTAPEDRTSTPSTIAGKAVYPRNRGWTVLCDASCNDDPKRDLPPAGQIDWDATLNEAVDTLPDGLNVYGADQAAVADFAPYILDPLAERKTSNPLEWNARLAERIEESPDRLRYRIYVRKGVRWHTPEPAMVAAHPWLGNPRFVTARDVKFTFDLLRNPDAGSALLGPLEGVESVTALDDYTCEVVWNAASFYHRDTLLTTGPLPEHIWAFDENGQRYADADLPARFGAHWFAGSICGNGPLRFLEYRRGESLRCERFEDYYDARFPSRIYCRQAIPSSVRIARFWTKDLATILPTIDEYRLALSDDAPASQRVLRFDPFAGPAPGASEYTCFAWRRSTYAGIAWNALRPPLADKRVRKALTLAFDRQAMIDAVLSGLGDRIAVDQAAGSPYRHAGLQPLPFDLAGAQKLLAEAGWRDGDGDGVLEKTIDGRKVDLELELLLSDSVARIAEQYQEHLKTCGVRLKPKPAEWTQWIEGVDARSYDGVLVYWRGDVDGDPSSLWDSKAADDPKSSNLAGFKHARADAIFEELSTTFDLDKRRTLFREWNEIQHEEQPYTWLYAGATPVFVNADWRVPEPRLATPQIDRRLMFRWKRRS